VSDISVRIKVASAADADTVYAMLCERDNRTHDRSAVLNYLADLDPGRVCVWLAERGGECLGINAIYLRSLRTADGPLAAGYWAHLYVRPEARKLMIYPRFVLDMMRWSRDAGLRLVYTGSRQQHVAAAHLRLGFHSLATFPVLLQPLRPATLVASRKAAAYPFAVAAARACDDLFRGVCRMLPRITAGQAPAGPIAATAVAPATVAAFCDPDATKIRTDWTKESWRQRFSGTIEGDPYTCFVVPSSERPEAGVMMRVAERGTPPVRVGVLMDIFDRTPDRRHLRPLLCRVAQAADAAGCAGVIAVDQIPHDIATAIRSAGYWKTSERYAIVAKATGSESLPPQLADASAWQFNFGEHDAF
jgi:hypothetical protein